ncbi:MAG: MFS transporter [Armatimonadota bacterium]
MSDWAVSAGSAQRWALVVTAVASLMVVLDALVVSTALSVIRLDLGASLEELEWTVTAYVLSFAVLLMTAAAFGDRFGRRQIFAAGLGVFAAASAAYALAPDIGWLIAARAVQGMGAALVMPLALALLAAAFPPQLRPRCSAPSQASSDWPFPSARSSAAQSLRVCHGRGSSGSTSQSACS